MDKIVEKFLSTSGSKFYTDIHSNLIEHLYHFLGENKSNNYFEIGEETFQSKINEFLHNNLNKSEYKAIREENVFGQKRLDHCIKHKESKTILACYELKTYFKESEVYVNKSSVYIDLIKLAIKKSKEPQCQSFFILAGKEGVLKKAFTGSNALIIPNKFDNIKNRSSVILTQSFLKTQISINNSVLDHFLRKVNKPISISPSVWSFYRGVAVISWKINKI